MREQMQDQVPKEGVDGIVYPLCIKPLNKGKWVAGVRDLQRLTEDSVDATIVLGIVGHLSVLPKDYFSTGGDHAQLRHVNLNHRTLREHAKLGVHR